MKKSRKAGDMMDQNPEVQEDLGVGGKFKNWLQDNIRIILSVLIVLAIAGGIYSYSKRTEAPTNEEIAMEEQVQGESSEANTEQPNDEEEAVTIIGDDQQKESENQESAQATQEETVVQDQGNETQQQEKQDVRVDNNQSSVSEETDNAFVQTAVRGDSKTTLARKALANYLEKNNDSSLTAEHKIYIEDYLRKQKTDVSGVAVGQKVEFSKDTIKNAIEKAKTLNDSQLNNLKKYSARVSTI